MAFSPAAAVLSSTPIGVATPSSTLIFCRVGFWRAECQGWYALQLGQPATHLRVVISCAIDSSIDGCGGTNPKKIGQPRHLPYVLCWVPVNQCIVQPNMYVTLGPPAVATIS